MRLKVKYEKYGTLSINLIGLFRYMMFHYPLTSAVVGSSLNMILLSVLFILSWYRFFINKDEEVLSEKTGLVKNKK